MTKITIKKTKDGLPAGFSCEGHAGYGDKGEDVVCSAISMLTINTVNSLEILTKEPMDIACDEANGSITVAFKQIPSEQSRLLVDSYILGISDIFNNYGKRYVQLDFVEV